MLRELHIRNYALLEDAKLPLRDGFNCLTGETGVGKSLVLGALDLLLGARARPDLVRKGAGGLDVEGRFEIEPGILHEELAEALGFALEDDVTEVLLERHYTAGGRNRCRVNGRPVSVATLRTVGERLVDIHGQQEHESLLHPSNQRALIDAYGCLHAQRAEFASQYAHHRELRRRFEELQSGEDLRRQRLELLAFQAEEIEALSPQNGEYPALRKEREILAGAEALQQLAGDAVESLYEMDDSALALIQRIARRLDERAASPKELEAASQALGEAAAQVEEATYAFRRFREEFEYDPARLEEIEERLATYERIASRHRVDPDNLSDLLTGLRDEKSRLESDDRDLAGMEERIATEAAGLMTLGKSLHARRCEAGEDLAERVMKEMRDLGMPAGRFRVDVAFPENPDLKDAGPHGLDAVEFMIATNPGEDLHPLRLVGSGGEIARVMLAIKSCLAQVDRTPVFIFDEIDANVGGRMGAVIGSKLSAISTRHQVVCITHLPQIAAFADVQVKVQKRVIEGRTVSELTEVSGRNRVEELAEMIQGEQRTDTTLRQAEEMLEMARKRKKRPKQSARRRTPKAAT